MESSFKGQSASFGQGLHDGIHPDELHALRSRDALQVFPGKDHSGKAQTLAFGQAAVALGNRAYFPGKSDLAEHSGFRGYRRILQRGRHGDAQGKIGGGLGKLQAAGYVDIHVLVIGFHAGALFQHREKQHDPAGVRAVDRAAGRGIEALGGQGLNIAQ